MKNQKKMNDIKLILLGDVGVGKTSIMQRIAKNKYEDTKDATIGIQYEIKIIKYKDKSYRIQLFDTAGQEKYKSIINSFYRLGNGFFVVFDLTNESSLNSVKNWIKEIQEKSPEPDPIIIILGNKNDLENIRISEDIIKKKLENYSNKIYIETSAKANTNITHAFEQMIDLIEKDDNLKSEISSFALNKKSHINAGQKMQCC